MEVSMAIKEGVKRRRFTAEFKAKVALEAAREQKTIKGLAQEYGVLPVQISEWKKQLLSHSAEVFSAGRKKQEDDTQKQEEKLYEQIGRLKMEVDFLSKKLGPIR
jgi:transposase